MYLIVERCEDGSTYAYKESRNQFRSTEIERQDRGSIRVSSEVLSINCDLEDFAIGTHIVIPIKKKKLKNFDEIEDNPLRRVDT